MYTASYEILRSPRNQLMLPDPLLEGEVWDKTT